jgi:hypothetical protein
MTSPERILARRRLQEALMKGYVMEQADRCRTQAEGCHRLMLLARSGAEATILTSLTRSWKMIANQTDRYVAIMRKAAPQNR